MTVTSTTRARAGVMVAALIMASAAGACDDQDTIMFEGGVDGGGPSTFVIEPDGDGGPGGSRAPGGGSGGSSANGGGDAGGAHDPGNEGAGEGTGGEAGEGEQGEEGGGSGEGGGGGGEAPAPVLDDKGRVGSMGRTLLRTEISNAAIEIDATPGESLAGASRSALQNQLAEHGSKSVSIVAGSALPEQSVYTSADLRSLMNAHRSTWSTNERLGIYVMVLSGRHEDDSVVGVSFNATSYAIFTEQLSGGLLGLNYVSYEEAVVVHELGHLFGLVNLTGHGAFHEDPAHKKHSANEGSVMFWAVESTLVGDVFEGGPPRDFDADDEQEMEAIRQSG
ncbi:MAG TPA: hypothetical protein VI916_00715 [Acidimicrobiia bacterium]|nr:hypothetical protein [Acidimicrobiia bacterium]